MTSCLARQPLQGHHARPDANAGAHRVQDRGGRCSPGRAGLWSRSQSYQLHAQSRVGRRPKRPRQQCSDLARRAARRRICRGSPDTAEHVLLPTQVWRALNTTFTRMESSQLLWDDSCAAAVTRAAATLLASRAFGVHLAGPICSERQQPKAASAITDLR